jgi:hypothetical protein
MLTKGLRVLSERTEVSMPNDTKHERGEVHGIIRENS